MSYLSVTAKTMSSREIAKLTGKEHSNVKRDIAVMVLQLNYPDMLLKDCPVFDPSELKGHEIELSAYKHCGNSYDEFFLDQEYSLLLVSGYKVGLRQKIIKRWRELEEQQAPKIPQTYGEALQLAADQAKQLEEQAPKIAVYEQLADRKGDVSTTVLAKQLGVTAIKLNKFLRDQGVKMQRLDAPKAGYQDYFNVISDVRNGHEFTQCLVTPLGQIEITKLWDEGE